MPLAIGTRVRGIGSSARRDEIGVISSVENIGMESYYRYAIKFDPDQTLHFEWTSAQEGIFFEVVKEDEETKMKYQIGQEVIALELSHHSGKVGKIVNVYSDTIKVVFTNGERVTWRENEEDLYFKLVNKEYTADDIEVGDFIEILVDGAYGTSEKKGAILEVLKKRIDNGFLTSTSGPVNNWSWPGTDINRSFKLIKKGDAATTKSKKKKEKAMYNFKTVGNKGVLNFKMPKRHTQRLNVQKLIKEGDFEKLTKYLSTFNATPRTGRDRFKPDRFKKGAADKLEQKGSDYYFNILKDWTNPSEEHSPISKATDWFGVEIECFIPYESLNIDGEYGKVECASCEGSGYYEEDEECEACSGSGQVDSDDNQDEGHRKLRAMFAHKKIKHVTVKSDGSIEPDSGYFAVEITVLSRLSDTKNLKATCELITSLQGKVNSSCGMHVHLDARHLDEDKVQSIAKNFKRALPVMLSMVPKSRRDNSYCRPRVSALSSNGDRYSAVNLTSYYRHKTIEIRLHSSTTNFDKIMNWVTFMDAIRSAGLIPNVCEDINKLTEYVNISQELMEYIGQRTALFAESSTATNPAVVDDDSTDDNVPEVIPGVRLSRMDLSSNITDLMGQLALINEAVVDTTIAPTFRRAQGE